MGIYIYRLVSVSRIMKYTLPVQDLGTNLLSLSLSLDRERVRREREREFYMMA